MPDVMHVFAFLTQFRYLGVRRRAFFFARVAAVANRGPIVQKSAGHKRHHPVESSTRGCDGAEEGGWGNGWLRMPRNGHLLC